MMEKFKYYFNTRKRIDSALSAPVNKSTMESILFNLIWYVYYNVSTDEDVIVNYIEQWMNERTDIYHLSAYAKIIKRYIKKVKDMPWRDIQDTVKIRKSELDYISSFNDIQKEKLLFCYLAVAKFNDMSRKSPTHWENESDITIFKMAKVPIPAADRDYFINELICGDPKAAIHLGYKINDTSKRIDYASDDENDPVVLELDESNYYELAFTYLNWKNGGGYKKCECCGRLFRSKSNIISKDQQNELNRANRTQYCRNCSPKYDTKYKYKDVMSDDYTPKKEICVVCKEEFYLDSYKNSRSEMCPECYKTHRRQRKTEVMRSLRAKSQLCGQTNFKRNNTKLIENR